MARSKRRKGPANAPTPLRGAAPVDYLLDLHGMRVAEALFHLDDHVRRNYAAGQPWVHIVHGRGTGALRNAVQDYLKKTNLVARYYYAPHNTGGDGVTIADLEYGQKRSTRRKIDEGGGPTDFDRRR